jgi:hypothetical protein
MVDSNTSFLAAPWFSIACLLVVMVASVVGVIALAFYDTLFQRLAMGAGCLGALVKVAQLAQDDQADPATALVFFSLAAYALATALKYWWRWKTAGKPGHPFRRSTDFGPSAYGAEAAPSGRRRKGSPC